jgi:steroid delta-isomerase-like uncharacterized protein
MAWEPVPLSLYGVPIPGPIRSSWVFILRAGAATGAERHPNSRQRMMSYQGTGDLQTGGEGQWQSHQLKSVAGAGLDECWISVPPGVWHQAVVAAADGDWVVVSFHTVAADELIEERPDAADPGRTHQRRYLGSPAQNKALVRQYYEAMWNRWDFTLADALIDEDVAFRGSLGIAVQGRAGFVDYMRAVHRAFPDFHNAVEELIAEGDRVVARLTYTGTHQGALLGIGATGRRATYAGVAIFRIAGGRVAEGWVLGDLHGLLRQLGAREPEAAPAAALPSTGPCIRDGRPEDVESLLALWRQAGTTVSVTDTSADLHRAITDSPAIVLVAEQEGQLIGSVIGSFDGWRGDVYRLAVHPGFRRQGIARNLVAELERRLARQGARRVTALVLKEQAQAMGFWRAVGYSLDPRLARLFRDLGPGPPAGPIARGSADD